MASEVEAPKLVEISINWSGGGKVAIREYGKITSDYHASLSRKYSVPESLTEEEVIAFQHEQLLALREELEPIMQAEFDIRYEQRDWND